MKFTPPPPPPPPIKFLFDGGEEWHFCTFDRRCESIKGDLSGGGNE